jgi:protein-S-isoprenylcysteine O-methyltransferase Ste14
MHRRRPKRRQSLRRCLVNSKLLGASPNAVVAIGGRWNTPPSISGSRRWGGGSTGSIAKHYGGWPRPALRTREGVTARARAIIGATLFFLIAPGTLVGLVPYVITGWRLQPPLLDAVISRVAGGALLVMGLAGLLECFWRFVAVGSGTPNPAAPPERLVISGLYRIVRNPMYVALIIIIFGEALVLSNAWLIAYACAVWAAFHARIVLYEEPKLRAMFGDAYDAYQKRVHRWLPRLTG